MNPQRLSQEDLTRLAAEPNTTVYEYTHTQLDEPMDMDRVEAYARKVFLCRARYEQEHASYEEDAAREWILATAAKSPEFKHFCTFTHHPIFHHLTRRQAGSTELRNVLGMIEVKRRALAGAPAAEVTAAFQSKVLAHTMSQSSSKSANRK